MAKKFRVQRSVEKAEGFQYFTVWADDAEEAAKIVEDGGGEFEEDEVEVTQLGPAEVLEAITDD